MSVVTVSCGSAVTTRLTPVRLAAPSPPSQEVWKVTPGWHALTTSAVAGVVAEVRQTTLPDGALVTVARFPKGAVQLSLHVGSEDPVVSRDSLPEGSWNAVTPAERSVLVGVFNGGFKHPADHGGFEVNGDVVHPLVDGAASLVIYDDGTFAVGAWNAGVPDPAKAVRSVRQNLNLLVSHGVAAQTTSNWGAWGSVIGTGSVTARSAIGTDAHGNLYDAASMHALPGDLATVLIRAGVKTAMELDINPYWPSLDTTRRPGGHLVAQLPGQEHTPSIYLDGWTRDFVVVTLANAVVCSPSLVADGSLNAFRSACVAR